MSRRAGMLTIIFILGILFTAAASAGATFVPFSAQRVLPNVYAGDLNLGGMTREQGILQLQQLADELREQTVTLKVGNQTRTLPLKAIGVDIDGEAVMDRALKAGHTGPIWKRWSESRRIRNEGARIPLPIKLNREKLRQEVDNLLAGITRPPVDASLHITPGDRVEIIPGRNGLQVDHVSLYSVLLNVLSTGAEPYQVEITPVDIKPGRTVEDIKAMGINGLLSSFTTRFNPDQVGRTYNVRVAAAALDGLLVPPGKEVSFNKVVGPRSTEAGYKNAKIILNNEFVEGLGGGVCQVSSTIYNAVLLADLTVTERNNHSLPVGYVPIGRDATVAYNYLDFCFQNTHDSYILVKSAVGYDTLTFKIFGNTSNKKDIIIKSWVTKVLEPEVIYEEDPNLAKGQEVVKQEGARGYKTSGVLVINQNGKTVTRPLPESFYRPMNKIIAVGTKETNSTIEIPWEEQPSDEDEAVTSPEEEPLPGNDLNENSVDETPGETAGEPPVEENPGEVNAPESDNSRPGTAPDAVDNSRVNQGRTLAFNGCRQ